MSRILGFQYPLETDEIDVVLRGRIVFNKAQLQWKTNCVEKGIKIKDDTFFNMKTGGDCNIFILLELLSKALDKDGSLSLIPKIMPSLLYTTNK